MDLIVSNSPAGTVMDWGAGPRRCAVGPAGIGQDKREGDGKTPCRYFPAPPSVLARRPDGKAGHYSARAGAGAGRWLVRCARRSQLQQAGEAPYPASAEHLWLESHLYDLVAVVGFNDDPVVPGKGSAIFLHLARDGYHADRGLRGADRSRSARRAGAVPAAGPGPDHRLGFILSAFSLVARSTENRLHFS